MSDAEETALAPMTPHGIAPSTFDGVWNMAERLATAKGFVPADMYKNPGAIAACILTGLELGLGPMQSLRSIHVIEGRPTLSADLMLSIALRGGVKHVWVNTNNDEAHVELRRPGHEPFRYSFTVGDAERANLMGKANWRKYTAAMLRARCISAALRAYCPDVIGAGVYVEGEIEPWDPADVTITIVKKDEVAPAPEDRPSHDDTVDSRANERPKHQPQHTTERAAPKPWTKQRMLEAAESATWCQKIIDADRIDQTVALAADLGIKRDISRAWFGPLSGDIDDGEPGIFPGADGTLTEEAEARMERETAAIDLAVNGVPGPEEEDE